MAGTIDMPMDTAGAERLVEHVEPLHPSIIAGWCADQYLTGLTSAVAARLPEVDIPTLTTVVRDLTSVAMELSQMNDNKVTGRERAAALMLWLSQARGYGEQVEPDA